MSGLFTKFDKHLCRVERILRTLGTEQDQFLPLKTRIKLVDQLVDDVLENKSRDVLIHDLLRHGVVGFFQMSDLDLMNAIHVNVVERGDFDDDSTLPTVIADLLPVLLTKEQELLSA